MINLRSFAAPTVAKHAPCAINLRASEIKARGGQRPVLVTDRRLAGARLGGSCDQGSPGRKRGRNAVRRCGDEATHWAG